MGTNYPDDWWKDDDERREPENHLAMQVMDGADRIKSKAADQEPSEYLSEAYDVDADEYHTPEALREEVLEQATGGGAR